MSEEYMKEVIEAYPYPGTGKVAIDLGANKGDYTELHLIACSIMKFRT